MADTQYEELGWEVEFEEGEAEGGRSPLLEPGYYPFEVKAAKKGFTNATPPYKCVDYSMKVGVGPNSAIVTDRIAMHSGMKWKLAQLATSLGVRKHGEAFKFSPTEVVGMKGWLEIEHREFEYTRSEKAGEKGKANNIARYLDPEDAPADGQPVIKGGGEDAADESWA